MNVLVAPGVSVAHEDNSLLAGFYQFAANYPGKAFVITSGDRTHQPASGPYPIAPEGKSMHERYAYHGLPDEAIDVTVNGEALGHVAPNSLLAAFGIHVPFANDPVHVTLAGISA